MAEDPENKKKTKEQMKRHTEDQANAWYEIDLKALSDEERENERQKVLQTWKDAEDKARQKVGNLSEGGKLHRS